MDSTKLLAYAHELRALGMNNYKRWPGMFMRKFKLSYNEAEQNTYAMFSITQPNKE